MAKPHSLRYIHFYLVTLIVLVPVVGYGIMHGVVLATTPPTEGSVWSGALLMLVMIALGLAIPYWMLKLGFFKAHLTDPHEKELHLNDIPKDSDVVGKE